MEKQMNIGMDYDGDHKFYTVFLPERKDYYNIISNKPKRRKRLIDHLLKERKNRSILNKITDRQMIRRLAKMKKYKKKGINALHGMVQRSLKFRSNYKRRKLK
jgi:hypothetical protein